MKTKTTENEGVRADGTRYLAIEFEYEGPPEDMPEPEVFKRLDDESPRVVVRLSVEMDLP